jgi:hypothetical protein
MATMPGYLMQHLIVPPGLTSSIITLRRSQIRGSIYKLRLWSYPDHNSPKMHSIDQIGAFGVMLEDGVE